MSALINDLLFKRTCEPEKQVQKKERQRLFLSISNRLHLNENCFKTKENSQVLETQSLANLKALSIVLRFKTLKTTQNTLVFAILLDKSQYFRIGSKHNEILFMKQLFKKHKQFPPQVNFYINNGRIVMLMNNLVPKSPLVKPSKIVQIYKHFIVKNLLNFQVFVTEFLKKNHQDKKQPANHLNELEKDLEIARILNTTSTSSNISEDKSQFKYAYYSLEKVKNQLSQIDQQMIEQNKFQKSVGELFRHVPEEMTYKWVKENFMSFYQNKKQKYKSLLNLKQPERQKKIEDFVFNTAQIDIKQIMHDNKPIGEGGSSVIIAAKAQVVIISSSDNKPYLNSDNKNNKTEQFVAIKNLRPGYNNRGRNKLQHQKQIVKEFRGSTCNFLPKYYDTAKQVNFLSKSLIMELVKGEQLDSFISSRQQTISLWSKIYILLNIIHAMRHLIYYEVTHLDLKPINILVCKFLLAKVIDFGESYHKKICPENYTPGFTFPYVAPEIYVRYFKQSFNRFDKDFEYSEKQDVYSFGIIMSELLFGSRIFYFKEIKFRQVYAKRQVLKRCFMAAERSEAYGDDIMMSSLLYIILQCIDPDPNKRPRFQWIGISLKLIMNTYNNVSL